jgi:hypothetical protein
MSGPGNPVTSGTTVFNPVATQIITAAFRKMNVINEDETPTAGMFSDAMFALNALMKELEAAGIHIWTEEEGIIFLQQYQRRYLLGTGQNGSPPADKACDANAWTLGVLASSANQGAMSVQVQSISGFSNGDNFGIVLNAGNAFWTTVSGVPAGNTVNLAAGLPGPTSAGAFAFDYPVSAQLVRPLRVPFSRRLQYSQSPQPGQIAPDWGGIITPLAPMMSRKEFFDLPQPNNPGLVTQAYYNPARDQGEMWVWNSSTNANWGLRFTYYRPLQDFNNPTDASDLPQEWANCLLWNLAKELLMDYSVPQARAAFIVQQASAKYDLVKDWDREDQSVYFGRSSSQMR